jgi:hypothetical protein
MDAADPIRNHLRESSTMASSDLVVRFAQSDADVVAIHRFLLVVAGPTLPGPVDGKESAIEVWRVVDPPSPDNPRPPSGYGFALMAMRGNLMVGTLGVINPRFWWNPALGFFASRWFFTIPGQHAAKPLLSEAKSVAIGAGLELHIYNEARGTITIFNKSKTRSEINPLLPAPQQVPAVLH